MTRRRKKQSQKQKSEPGGREGRTVAETNGMNLPKNEPASKEDDNQKMEKKDDSKPNSEKESFKKNHPVLFHLIKCFIPIFTFIAGLASQYIINYIFPKWFNKPDVNLEVTDISNVDLSVYLKSQVVTSDVLSRYTAIIESDESYAGTYGFICGDARNPGHGDIVLRLSNHGKAQATIQRFEVDLQEYEPIEGIDYSIKESSKISKPDEYVVLYGSIDPSISNAKTYRTEQVNTDEDIKISELPIDTSLSPEEHGTYYLRASFLKYGAYVLKAKVYYTYDGINAYSEASEPIYILYDDSYSLESRIEGIQ